MDDELDCDQIEALASLAVKEGKSEQACPYTQGSDAADFWLFSFESIRARPYFQAGRWAAKNGFPKMSYPLCLAPALLDSWERGWQLAIDGPFPALKDIKITYR